MRSSQGSWNCLSWRKLRGPYHSTFPWKEVVVRWGVRLFSQVISDVTRGNCLNLHQGRFRYDIRKEFTHWKDCQALEQAAQGIHHIWRYLKDMLSWHLGTWLSGRVDSAGSMLELYDLFSNLNDSNWVDGLNPVISFPN